MAFQGTPADVPVIISTPTAGRDSGPAFYAERRITPSWTVMHLKSKLETMTGIPPGSQRLLLKSPGRPDQWTDGDDRVVGDWALMRGCEIEVCILFVFIPISWSIGELRCWIVKVKIICTYICIHISIIC